MLCCSKNGRDHFPDTRCKLLPTMTVHYVIPERGLNINIYVIAKEARLKQSRNSCEGRDRFVSLAMTVIYC